MGVEVLRTGQGRRPHEGSDEGSTVPDIQSRHVHGSSEASVRLRASLAAAAASDSTVLLLGETGTGKELAAQMIHTKSPRGRRELVALNCAAIPDALFESEVFGHERGAFTGAVADRRGAFEQARGGTLFLDEIGDITPYAQAKLLRAIETRSVRRLGGERERATDFRLIAATHRDLPSLVESGGFRADLYYRIDILRVELPPLRARAHDLQELCELFIEETCRRTNRPVAHFDPGLREVLRQHHWPGNIRELRNTVEAILANHAGNTVLLDHLPPHLRIRFDLGRKEQRAQPGDFGERELLLDALYKTNWNKSRAANMLRWSRMTLYRKMNKYGIGRGRSNEPTEG